MVRVIILDLLLFFPLFICGMFFARNKGDKIPKKDMVKTIIVFVSLIVCGYFSIRNIFFSNVEWNTNKDIWKMSLFIAYLANFFFGMLVVMKILSLKSEYRWIKRISRLYDNLFASDDELEIAHSQSRSDILNKFVLLSVPSCGIIYMLFIFGECEVYFANLSEWQFQPLHFVIFSILLLIVTLIISGIGAVFLKPKEVERVCILLTGVMLASYIQNAFLNVNQFIDGIRLEIGTLLLICNTLIWVIIVFGPIIVYECAINQKRIVKGTFCVTTFLSVMLLITLPIMLFGHKESQVQKEETELILDGSEQYMVSSNKNVIVFIVDTFDTGSFNKFIATKNEKYAFLNDFVYYDNVNTNAYYTAFSIPYMLTAADVNFDVSLVESDQQAWNGNNANQFYSALKNEEYSCMLYIDSSDYLGGAECMQGKIDNIIEADVSWRVDSIIISLEMAKLSLYRYVPIGLKDIFYVYDSAEVNRGCVENINGVEIVSSDNWQNVEEQGEQLGVATTNKTYYSGLQGGLSTVDNGNRFIVQYLLGMHAPYMNLDETETVSCEEETEICMQILNEYIEGLKSAGVYDDTCIIITADHGMHELLESDPILLAKGFDEHGKQMRVNHAPGTIQSDLLPTILDYAGFDSTKVEGGYSLRQLDESTKRERFVRQYMYLSEFPRVPKCDAYGTSVYNCYKEYHYTGKTKDIDIENDCSVTAPIYDYWW